MKIQVPYSMKRFAFAYLAAFSLFLVMVSPPAAWAQGAAGDLHARTLVEFPGKDSVGLATTFTKPVSYQYRYGDDPDHLDRATPLRTASAGSVARDRITGLQPGRVYHYRLAWVQSDSTNFTLAAPGGFATKKAQGSSFTFDLEADPHLDGNSSGPGYLATLTRMAADSPDFVIDLGDTSMVEKLASTSGEALARNRLVRSYWDEVGNTSAFFMVIGNHDGEQGWSAKKGMPTSAEAAALRETWLVDPRSAPNDTYDRLSDTVYGFEWGDALFVVLDPFLAETRKPGEDGWSWALGKKQYDWLAATLGRSTASYKFLFIHNLVGGKGRDARGGADPAGNYEWGGLGAGGKDEFAKMRPGWAMPVHHLLIKTGVSAVFHGHDHFYAREEKDGILYQLTPQPSLTREQRLSQEELSEYGYSDGVFLPSPGYLRVSVSPERARVEYARAGDGGVADACDITPKGKQGVR